MGFVFSFLDSALLSACKLAMGPAVADKLRVAADWHHPLVGSRSPRSRRSRWFLRSFATCRSTAKWLDFLWSRPDLLNAARQNPDLLEKIHRPYLRKKLSAADRFELLESHYAFCLAHPHGSLLLQASLKEVELAEILGKNGVKYRLTLKPAGALQKEGELVLHLEGEGFSIIQLAFTCSMTAGVSRILVGCLQGNPDQACKDKIREATKEMFGLRPRNLALLSLQTLAQAYGIKEVLGVEDAQHIYRHWRKRRKIFQSYNEIWADLGGAPGFDGMYALPSAHVQRPLTEYPSNKRSTYAKRHVLECELMQQILATVAKTN